MIKRIFDARTTDNLPAWQQELAEGDRLAAEQMGPVDRTITQSGDQIEVEWTARLQQKLETDTSRIQSAQVIAKAISGNRMGKLHEVAQRVALTKQRLSDEADKLATRLDQIDQKAPGAFANANSILDQHNSDLDAMESELRQLSNLPLDGSQGQ